MRTQKKQERLDLNDLTWHDGRFLGLHSEVSLSGKSVVTLTVSLLVSLDSKERNTYVLKFKKPSRLISNFDFELMKKNYNFGNISEGRVYKDSGVRICIYLVEGHIEIVGEKVDLVVA